MISVIIPEGLWEGADPGSVANWFFENGARVRAGDLLCEVMTEKVTHEIRAPVSGILTIRALTDTVVYKTGVIALIQPTD